MAWPLAREVPRVYSHTSLKLPAIRPLSLYTQPGLLVRMGGWDTLKNPNGLSIAGVGERSMDRGPGPNQTLCV